MHVSDRTGFAISLCALIAGLSQSPASYAQCAPDPTVPGGTVTCAGVDPDGFSSAFDNLTVNITGAVNTAIPNSNALDFTGSNINVQMTGTGSITPAVSGSGIRFQGDDSVVYVGPNASITVDNVAAGIVLEADNAQITIDGSISGSNFFGHGVLNFSTNNNRVTVNASGSVVTTGDDARGIDLQSSNAVITVAGTVTTSGGQTTGDAAHALIVGDGNLGTTGGEISLLPTARVTTSGEGAGAVLASGPDAMINIAAGAIVTTNGNVGGLNGIPSFGVGSNGDNNVVNNSGDILANPATGSVAALLGRNNAVFNHNDGGTMVGGGLFPGVQIAFAFLADPGENGTLNNFGTITGTVVSFGDGNATVNNLGGTISEHVILGLGNDLVNAQSPITGDVELDEGSDELIMLNAQIVGGVMNGGDDTGAGDGMVDVLRIQGGSRTIPDNTLSNWEIIQLTDTALSIDTAALAVGADPGTDPGSGLPYGITLQSNASLDLQQSLTLDGNVSNGASITLTPDNAVGTLLTINGNYTGANGIVVLDALLSGDSSTNDRIIVDGGSISGTTRLAVRDLGGLGGATEGDGVLVIETTGGATSTPDAFTMGLPIIIDGFEYALFFGGLNDPDDGNWYLRSSPTRPVPALSGTLLGVTAVLLLLLGLCGIGRNPRA